MLIVFLIYACSWLHPFYVSVTSIEYTSSKKTVQISTRIFFDDFEKVLSHTQKTKVDLFRPADRKQVDQAIAAYLKATLRFQINGKPVAFHYLGYEIEEDAAWCYMEIDKITSIKQLSVDNRLLYDAFENQINIVHVSVNGIRKSEKLTKGESVGRFVF